MLLHFIILVLLEQLQQLFLSLVSITVGLGITRYLRYYHDTAILR